MTSGTNFVERRHLAESFNIFIFLSIFATITSYNACDLLYLLIRPVAMRAIYLPIDISSVNKKNFVFAIRLLFASIQKPERYRKRHIVKHVRAHSDHYIY